DDLLEPLPVSIELRLIELAAQEFRNDLLLRNPAQLGELGIEHVLTRGGSTFTGPQKRDGNCHQQCQHQDQLHYDHLAQVAVDQVNAGDDCCAEAQLQPTDVADLSGNLVAHQHYAQGIQAG